MVRVFKCVVVMMWASQAYGFEMRPELKPFYDDSNLNSIILRKPQEKSGADWVRIIEVTARNAKGVPIAFRENSHLECVKCKKNKSACSCSMSSLPSQGMIESPVSERRNAVDSSVDTDEESSLLSVEPHSPSRVPNRFMQVLATCVSFPQLLCIGCCDDFDDEAS